jgi:hypothetical protein
MMTRFDGHSGFDIIVEPDLFEMRDLFTNRLNSKAILIRQKPLGGMRQTGKNCRITFSSVDLSVTVLYI